MSDETPIPSVATLLRADEAAKALRVSTRTLWTLADAGKIRVVRIGRSVRFRPADIEAFIESCASAANA